MKTIYFFSIGCILFLSSCASIFIPAKQKVTFNTGNKDSEVYLDKEMIGEGRTFTVPIDKREGQARQLTIKRKGYKDQYSVIIKTRRPGAFLPLLILDIPTYYGLILDPMNPKCTAFDKIINLENEDNKLVTRGATDKYLHISNIKLNINKSKKDLPFYYIAYDSKSLKKAIETAEIKKTNQDAMEEAKKNKKSNNKKTKTLEEDDDNLKYDDTKYSYNVYQTLKKTGFVDTVNKIFQDDNNTLVLEASINRISTFRISKGFVNSLGGEYYKAKVYLTWYIKNTYNEILDSIVTTELSGDFDKIYTYENSKANYDGYGKMIGDAIDISYLKLHHGTNLNKYLQMESDFKSKDPLMTLKAATGKITDKSDAALACVTIKLKEDKKDVGHGSGFAITPDGYILTNYHVVAGKTRGKYNDLTVITSEGIEMPAKVVRVNSYRDLALIKVDGKFQKQFAVSSTKSFKKMQDVYTIGTPKSIELGQSVSVGIISNERKTETTNLLQLAMSVNSGNSGGPLFDANGNLQGIINAKLIGQNTEGVSFAIPGYLIEEYLNINFK
jgi:S1-C subfamily serine protease